MFTVAAGWLHWMGLPIHSGNLNGKEMAIKKVTVLSVASGFTLPALLAIIVIMGIALTSVAQLWSVTMKREREMELIFRGTEIKEAIERYHTMFNRYPQDLEVLVTNRFLRKVYKDPFTAETDWILILENGGIVGVRSRVEERSFRVFDGKRNYNKWIFKAYESLESWEE